MANIAHSNNIATGYKKIMCYVYACIRLCILVMCLLCQLTCTTQLCYVRNNNDIVEYFFLNSSMNIFLAKNQLANNSSIHSTMISKGYTIVVVYDTNMKERHFENQPCNNIL